MAQKKQWFYFISYTSGSLSRTGYRMREVDLDENATESAVFIYALKELERELGTEDLTIVGYHSGPNKIGG
jgi:hypothetical protein